MSDFIEALKALLIIAGILMLIVVLPLSAEHQIAGQCDDFGRMRAAGHVYSCERLK